MSRLHRSLGDGMRHQEEVECTIDHFRLLDETVVDIGTLRWIGNATWSTHLEESLSYSLVNDDESVLWKLLLLISIEAVLLLNNLVQLFQLVADDLSSH